METVAARRFSLFFSPPFDKTGQAHLCLMVPRWTLYRSSLSVIFSSSGGCGRPVENGDRFMGRYISLRVDPAAAQVFHGRRPGLVRSFPESSIV